MKKVHNLTIKVKFPYITEEKKNYLLLMRKNNNNIKSIYLNKKEKSKIKPLKHFNSVNLLETLSPFPTFNTKRPLFKSFSNNDLYITKLPSEEKRKKPNVIIDYENFGEQVIPPYPKTRLKLKKKKKINYKELQYIGALLGVGTSRNKKDSKKKNFIPLETRKDYFNYIRHKRNLFFSPNATSNFVHEKSTNFLISTITKSRPYSILNENYKREKNEKEEALELRDKVPNISYEQKKMIKIIKNLFSQDFKFNNVQFNEDFYQSSENRINFMQDILRVPVIKNNLVKIKIDKNVSFTASEWKKINVINHQTWDFLMQIKRKLQREKDEKNKKLEEFLIQKRQKEKEYEILEKKVGGEINSQKNEKEVLEEEEKLKKIVSNIIENEEKKSIKFEDLYSAEEYFLRRNSYFDDSVSIASDKLRNIFFNNQ